MGPEEWSPMRSVRMSEDTEGCWETSNAASQTKRKSGVENDTQTWEHLGGSCDKRKSLTSVLQAKRGGAQF